MILIDGIGIGKHGLLRGGNNDWNNNIYRQSILKSLADQVHSGYPGQKGVYLRADSQTPWGEVATVMSVLAAAKLDVNAVTQPNDNTGKKR